MEWDADIASLLDDVLQDKKPDTPEVVEDEVVTGDDLVTEPTPEALSCDEGEDEVTTVVSPDVEAAELPPIDNTMFSEPVEMERIPVPTFTDDELMESIDVRNFGTLVSLTNRRWHAKVKDKKAAKDAADASGAAIESFEARKRLLVGADEKLKKVHKCIDSARTEHYGMTLPWSIVGINDHGKRAGARLLPNSLFFEYTERMAKHKMEMEEALEDFIDAYPTLIRLAQQKLGTSFNQNEYPRPDTIGAHFDLSFDFEPIPTGSDFQGLQDAQVSKLSDALKRKTQQKIENAMQDGWQRLFEDVGHTAATLSNPDAMFHYTLFDKLREHSTMLSHLNVTSDQRIETIRTEIEQKLTKWDAKEVRKDDALRKRLAGYATEIHNQMKEYVDVGTTETN